MKKKRYWIFAGALLCIVAIVAVSLFRHFQTVQATVQALKEQGIYKLITLSPETYDGETMQHSYFIVCEPSDDNNKLKEQIDTYIKEKNVIATLETELAEKWDGPIEDVELHLWFLEPNKAYPIGRFPDNEESFDPNFCKTIGKYIYQDGERTFEHFNIAYR